MCTSGSLRTIIPVWLFLLSGAVGAGAQCGTVISSFPYHEDFETSNGGWVAGGMNNDWTWGAPVKPTITGAGSGTKCWITGGLSGSFYNLSQRSFLESPCFDFTNLDHPYVHFKIYWESERSYDGTNLQYSLDGGNSWTNVGWVNDPVDCYNDNWYNHPAISNLTNLATIRHGWSGTIKPSTGSCEGGNGSNGWLTVKHCMPYLAGQANVQFRFTFGAGSTCNSYDGVAIDDLYFENAPPVAATITATCAGTNAYVFTSSASNCPETWNWDFGDPLSGVNNSSAVQNPIHIFSTPGVYTVSLLAGNDCSGNTLVTTTVKVLGITFNVTPVACNGDQNGAVTAQVAPPGSAPVYQWNQGQNSAAITGLPAGTYTVSVTATGACPATVTVTLDEPAVLQHTSSSEVASCGNANGSAAVMETGGTAPYTYQWSPSGGVDSSAVGLLAGNYVVTVSDSHGCTDTVQIVVVGLPEVQAVLSVVPVSCFGSQNGSATVSAAGGTAPFIYAWSTTDNGASLNGLAPGAYTVTLTDANLCTDTAMAMITEPTLLEHTSTSAAATCGIPNGSASVMETGGTPQYTYNWSPTGGTNATATGLSSGNYIVTVTDSRSCTDTIQISVGNIGGVQAGVSSIMPVSCFGGSNGGAIVIATGGAPPYMYDWSPTGGNGPSPGGLTAGNYFVTVTDAHQCIAALALNIPQPLQAMEIVLSTLSGISCSGAEDGSLMLAVTGGTSPYAYAWSPPGGNSASISDLAPGAYSATVTDAAGCTGESATVLPDATPVMTQAHSAPVHCHGEANGAILVDTSHGGTPPYLYALNQSAYGPQPTFSNLSAGNYQLFTQDANGCISVDSFLISDPPLNTVQIGADTTLQLGDSIQLDAFVAYPGGIVQFLWEPASGLACDTCASTTARPFANTVYTLFVTDSSGCVISDSRKLFVKAATVYIPNVFMPGASAENDRFTVYASPGAEKIEVLQVYDRWGGLVFENRNFQPSAVSGAWDGKIKGKDAPAGVYTYFCRVGFLGGTFGDYEGSVTILR